MFFTHSLFSPSAFKIFLVFFGFQQFEYDVFKIKKKFFYVQFDVFYHFWKILSHFLFKYYFWPKLLLGLPIMCMSDQLMVLSHSSQILCSALFFPFFPSVSFYQVISVAFKLIASFLSVSSYLVILSKEFMFETMFFISSISTGSLLQFPCLS